MNLYGVEVSDSWTLVVRKNVARARDIQIRLRTVLFLILAVLVTLLVAIEIRTSWFQAHLFSAIDRRVVFSLRPGPSPALPRAAAGPYDRRLGYYDLPAFTRRLQREHFQIAAQAQSSGTALSLTRMGIFPIYREPTQTGLKIMDRQGDTLFNARYPSRIYADFQSIPPLVVNTLLFIENRQLRYETGFPHRNPAIEWGRTGRAVIDLTIHALNPSYPRIGGSTLATQLEKLRHSSGGQTQSVGDKGRQMLAASLRAYLGGSITHPAEKQIICDYLNSIPLAATPAQGEILGLADGLQAWYGADFNRVNQLLSTPEDSLNSQQMAALAVVYRQVLSLLLAMRAPTMYLIESPSALAIQTDRYLRVLAADGIISPRLRDAALRTSIQPRPSPAQRDISFVADKAPNAIRMSLLPMLGLDSTYALDRLDLTVQATLDKQVQNATTQFLQSLSSPAHVAAAGMVGDQLLNTGSPRSVIYSFTLYEHSGGANLLRVQTDNFDQPLDINKGTKLQLGSTAKLRTLINYLQIVEQLHSQYAGYSVAQLRAEPVLPGDRLTAWALSYLAAAPDRSLKPMLEAALQRTYSGSTGEAFFTAGGLHTFANFEREEDYRVFTVGEGFEKSVNLVFIRLLRDIENYYKYRAPGASPSVLTNPSDPMRQHYLARFADMEGRVFLRRFYEKYNGQTPDQALETLVSGIRLTPLRAAVIYRSVHPEAGIEDLRAFLKAHLPAPALARVNVADLYAKYGPDKFNLQDRGYLARIHPLELWLVSDRQQHPNETLAQIFDASASQRQQVYQWLFKLRSAQAQNTRIQTMLEIDAFKQIHSDWAKLGYPFESLVPSYATAIGVSGDTPAALATLVGIILNNGVLYPSVSIERLHFGAGTPFETILARRLTPGRELLNPEIASLVRQEMLGVVQNGTGRRLKAGITLPDGTLLPVGGKTGTGENLFHVYGARGALLDAHTVNRTAAFTFFIGDRFFGSVLAFVPGEDAGGYQFTSALAVQVLRELTPNLLPLLEQPVPASQNADRSLPFGLPAGQNTQSVPRYHRVSQAKELPPQPPGTPAPSQWQDTAAMATTWRFPLVNNAIRSLESEDANRGAGSASRNRAENQQWLASRSHRFRQLRIRRLV